MTHREHEVGGAPVSCISGGTSGLGLALVEELLERRGIVYAGARSGFADGGVPPAARALQLDVTRPAEIAAAIERIDRECGRLDLLVSNAGVHVAGPWELVPEEVLRHAFEVNFFGAVRLVQAALPLLRHSDQARIVFISSLSGLVALPADGVYAASKFALEAFAESLANEVKRFGVRVTVVNPGGYATGLARKGWRPQADSAGLYGPLLQSLETRGGEIPARQAAAAVLQALEAPTPPLHVPIDAVGRRVFATLGTDSPQARENLIRSASGLGWWIDGAAGPARDTPS